MTLTPRAATLIAVVALVGAACSSSGDAGDATPVTDSTTSTVAAGMGTGTEPEVEFLSARPDVVTGGGVLVAVGTTNSDVAVSLNGTDISGAFGDPIDGRQLGLVEDDSGDDRATLLERHRPDDAVDNCLDADGTLVSAPDLYDNPGPCTDRFPISGTPRTVAGAARAENIIKCQLRSVADAVADGVYQVELDEAQRTRLEAIFPDGVCDYSVIGVGQVAPTATWQSFN
ncbi:MAG: DUF6351 family protein [Acidimicrobiia bacterium]|nr:DUF6351 family protein [Acidimicrobiia bacterium]